MPDIIIAPLYKNMPFVFDNLSPDPSKHWKTVVLPFVGLKYLLLYVYPSIYSIYLVPQYEKVFIIDYGQFYILILLIYTVFIYS